MPPSARITFRLTPALAPLVADCIRQGNHVSGIVREALEAYFGVRQTQEAAVSDSTVQVSDRSPDLLSDITTTVSDMVSAVSAI